MKPTILRAAIASQLVQLSTHVEPRMLEAQTDARLALIARCDQAEAMRWLGLPIEQMRSLDMAAPAAFSELSKRKESHQ